jgi:hypothetical protein
VRIYVSPSQADQGVVLFPDLGPDAAFDRAGDPRMAVEGAHGPADDIARRRAPRVEF